jgi:hypothetical protein
MKLNAVHILFFVSWIGLAHGVFAITPEPPDPIPPVVAQAFGPGNTIVMWHDTNDDGNPDFKATYIFINGKLQLVQKISYPPNKP